MANEPRQYELVLLLDPQAEEAKREQVVDATRSAISSDGELHQENRWGVRKLAYEIRKRTEADYRWFRFAAPPELLAKLDHSLKIADGLLRSRLYEVEPGSTVISAPPAAGAAVPVAAGDDSDED